MSNEQKIFISGLMIISVLLFIASAMWCLIKITRNKRMPEKRNKAGVSTALVFSGFLILAIWILRFAVGYFAIVMPKPDVQPLTSWEELFNSFFGTLRTFSMEEEYAEYIRDIKMLICEMVPGGSLLLPICQTITVAYASLLNLIAPIAGGAIILEVLASVFPKVKLRLSYLNIRRKKYYFSELNAASLALAKSISLEKKDEKPVLIFTDTYVDDEKEKDYELLLEAKQYGAICVRDDLAHVVKSRFGKREYYLMDENEFGNLQTLMGLVEDRNIQYIKSSYVYLFVQSDAYVQIEKQVKEKLLNDHNIIKTHRKSEMPVIIPVRGYRNLVHNLLVNVPLYEPLVQKADQTKLNVTILGNGVIGTEAFLSTYWFGQMMISRKLDNDNTTMTECDLTINVVSKDTEDVFWSKIDYINPEIKATIEILGESTSKMPGDILCYNSSGLKNKPYCKVRYIQADVKIGGFWNGEIEEAQHLLDSDYFIVALGNDADNISVAEKLRCSIGKKHLEAKSESDINNTVIAYTVFDSELSKVLNKQKCYQSRDKGKTDIYMHAFGSLEQVYSCDNVYMSQSMLWAEETGNAYLNSHHSESHLNDNKDRSNDENANYNYWANLARAMHVKYKVFSLGWIDTSVFDYSEEDWEKHRNKVKACCRQYRKLAVMYKPEDLVEDEKTRYIDLETKKHCLAWLEHRRWCAFTRTMGYQHADIVNNLHYTGSHKNMPIKLHACLVEARFPKIHNGDTYILASFDKYGKIDNNTMFKDTENSHRDCLDEISFACRKHDANKGDFKEYDYYRYEFDDYILTTDLKKELSDLNISNLEEYCSHEKYEDPIKCNTVNGLEYLISVNSVKRALETRYRQIDINSDERILKYLKDKNMRDAFEFHDSWFATKFNVWLATIICDITNRQKE